MLRACKRVLRPGGRMAFHVIHLAPGLDGPDLDRAVATGPPFVASDLPYPELLAGAGFTNFEDTDVTDEWRTTQAGWLVESEKVSTELGDVYGAEEVAESQEERRNTLDSIDAGLLKRSLYAATVS